MAVAWTFFVFILGIVKYFQEGRPTDVLQFAIDFTVDAGPFVLAAVLLMLIANAIDESRLEVEWMMEAEEEQ